MLNARGANISGETNISGGTVGGCSIVDGVLQITNDNIAGLITAAKLDADYLNADDVVISGEITATKEAKLVIGRLVLLIRFLVITDPYLIRSLS